MDRDMTYYELNAMLVEIINLRAENVRLKRKVRRAKRRARDERDGEV